MSDSKTILVVDDEPELLGALEEKLNAAGYTVHTAQDGEEGLKHALEHKPALILLDIVMPKMDGFEVLKRLREDEWGKTVTVMLLTVLDDVDSISRAVEAQGYEYLIKTDWKLDEIVGKVEKALAS